jgi:hypothetical protein
MFSSERGRLDGAEDRDLSVYSEWRERTDKSIQEVLDLYGAYLFGQTQGMGDALNLQSVLAVFEIEQIPQAQRPRLTGWFLQIHGIIMTIIRRREERKQRNKPRG